MNTRSSSTETVVSHHLQAFLRQEGVDAIVDDYSDTARFYTETKIHHGKDEIRDFFVDFIQALPEGAVSRFELRTMQVEGRMAYITWNVGTDIPLGTDTFVVENGRIVLQSFAMYVPSSPSLQAASPRVDAVPASISRPHRIPAPVPDTGHPSRRTRRLTQEEAMT